MSDELPRFPGCQLAPEGLGAVQGDGALDMGLELPEQFIVSAWRECFDENFNPIPLKIEPRILNQGAIDSCVGHGTSVQKSAQEGVVISPRDIFRLAKRQQGEVLSEFGTTLAAGQDALVETGAAERSLVPDDPAMGREAYLTDDAGADVKTNRAMHKSRKPLWFQRTQFMRAMFQFDLPIVTSSPWYPEDNNMGPGAVMRMPLSLSWVGHCFACIGWINRTRPDGTVGRCMVMVNSFGPRWGYSGLFFVPTDGTEARLRSGAITVDDDNSLVAVLVQFNGRDVKVMGTPDHWRIENGMCRKWPDEITWWAFGNLFGHDTYEITPEQLAVVPVGRPMSIDDAPFKTRELVRQVRQYYGKL